VSGGLIDKTDKEYNNVAQRLTLRLRREGRVDYNHIADGSRFAYRTRSVDSVDDALARTAQTYRRSLWSDAPVYVEVWSEKDAISGVLWEELRQYDVPLLIARGFSSETFVWQSAQDIRRVGKPTFLYHFGDHDPSGVAAGEDIARKVQEFAAPVQVTFVRAAVTPQQIAEMNLPTRPTKSSNHSANWEGESVEVDAIRPRELRRIARELVEQHVDQHALQVLRNVEAEERELFERMREAVEFGWFDDEQWNAE
jgi:hypothetical protein